MFGKFVQSDIWGLPVCINPALYWASEIDLVQGFNRD